MPVMLTPLLAPTGAFLWIIAVVAIGVVIDAGDSPSI
jgi:hypothetical protein